MRLFSRLIGTSCIAAILSLCSSASFAAGPYYADYTVNLTNSEPITNVTAYDRDTNGNVRRDWTYSFSAAGNNTLHNPNPSVLPLQSFFLIGTFLDPSSKLHVFLTMNTPSGLAVNGTLFFDEFGYHETPILNAIKAVGSGLPASDPSVIAGLATLDDFANTQQSKLFANFGDGNVSMHFTPGTIGGAVAPLPAASVGGGALLGLLAVGGLARRMLGSRKLA